MDRRILIAGASGYVGGRLLRALKDAGQTVRCVARLRRALRNGRWRQTEPRRLVTERPARTSHA